MTKKKQRGVKRNARRLDDALGALSTKPAQRPQNAGRSLGRSKSKASRSKSSANRSKSSRNHPQDRDNRNQDYNPERSGYRSHSHRTPNQNQQNPAQPRQIHQKPGQNHPEPMRSPKVPEALPLKSEKLSAVSRLTARVFKKPAIQEVVREPTAGGIVFRHSRDKKDIEILLIQDSKGRWTIPKGHIEPGENAKQTAVREIGEESGLYHIEVLMWLGKIHFQYRRIDKLVLMTTQIYLVRALDDHETPTKEQWMKGIKWFRFNDALDAIEYEDIEKLMLLAKNKIRQGL